MTQKAKRKMEQRRKLFGERRLTAQHSALFNRFNHKTFIEREVRSFLAALGFSATMLCGGRNTLLVD